MNRLAPCLVWALLFLAGSLCLPWTGKRVAVPNSDTIRVMHLEKAERTRLYGIDCPERGQDFLKVARKFTSRMVFGKVVNV